MKPLTTILILCSIVLLSSAEGAEVPDNLWKVLLLEAADQGYDGLYAVCCVYRNRLDRGMSLGCSGLKRPNIDKWIDKNTTKKHRDWAKSIVNKVFMAEDFIDKTGGACFYENVQAFGLPYWAKNKTQTCKIGAHTFWK
jgi:hypothetical protein